MFEGTITNAPHVPRLRAMLDSREMARNAIAVFEGTGHGSAPPSPSISAA